MKTADQIIAEIAEVLAESDGEFIAQIANQVLTNKVTYDGDSMFVEENDEEAQFELSRPQFDLNKVETISPTQATRIRIFAEGLHWSIDAADEAGNYTETVWDHYNGKRMNYRPDAIKAVKAFAIEIGRVDLLTSVYAERIDGSGFEKLTDGQVFSIIPRRN